MIDPINRNLSPARSYILTMLSEDHWMGGLPHIDATNTTLIIA
jgi:hypothetical protein